MLLVIVKDESGKMIDGRVQAHALHFHKLSPVSCQYEAEIKCTKREDIITTLPPLSSRFKESADIPISVT